jgi:protein-disulfide isomerase
MNKIFRLVFPNPSALGADFLQKLCQTTVILLLSVFLALTFLTSGYAAASSNNVVAEVDGEVITAEQVEKPIGASLAKLQEEIHNLKRQRLEAIIAEKLLAKEAQRQGISVPALLDKEVTSKVGLVTEQEIDDFYQSNKARIQGEASQVREQIRNYLQNQKLTGQREKFFQSLRANAKVVVHLQPPPTLRLDVKVDGAPFKGEAKAPVTIVKFEDFHCPFCKQVQQTFAQLLSRYGNKLKIVHRDFPIDSLHPQARKAHEGARCANEQGKFWTYHDRIYANAPKASPEDLKAYAKESGLNVAAFEKCLDSGKYKDAVQKDVEQGSQLGVNGTPAFFVNGRFISGAQTLESFVRIIEDELVRLK